MGEPIGSPERITTGLDMLQTAFTVDGRKLAYVKGRNIANVWRVPATTERALTWADAQPVTFDQAWIEAFDLSPDGTRLAVQSDRSGNPDIWIAPSNGGEMQQFTHDSTPEWWPTWSQDGMTIAYYALRSGTRQIWIQGVGGGPAHQLTSADAGAIFPRWSRDGRTIYFGNGAISAMPAAGGEPHVVIREPRGRIGAMEFAISPDGGTFAFSSGAPPDRRLWRASSEGAGQRPLTRGQASAPAWSRDGRWIYFTTSREAPDGAYQVERPGLNIWRVASSGGSERPVTNFVGKRGFLGPTIATDDHWLYFTWRDDVADIGTMDVVRN